MTGSVRDRLRTLLKIRKPRALPERGPRPHVGSRIYRDGVRMTVQAGMTTELWQWLQERGWREVGHKPDRRHYRDVPSECVAELIDCAREQRADVLANAIARAGER